DGIDTVTYSGFAVYNQLGQPVIQLSEPLLYNVPINYYYVNHLISNSTGHKYSQIKYDTWGREIKTVLPDNTEINTSYSIDNGWFKTSVTDALNQTSHVWKDVRGLQMKMQSPLGATTQFFYDGLGQLKKTIDPETLKTVFKYDILGRTVSIDHPSRGLTFWTYDSATANVKKETNAKGEVTFFEYDVLGRPTAKHYSVNPQNDVYYQYGDPNTGYQSGRLVKLQDATGVSEYEYGNMGEVTAQNRMHILPNKFWLTHRTEWKYDSWGRTKEIKYPDGELVNYQYNNAGNLINVASNTNGNYIDSILYNKFEQKTDVFYGNNTFAQYNYEPIMNRLTSQMLFNNVGNVIMEKNYSYNDIGNIVNQNDFYNFAGVNYDINHNYNYDKDNRLDTAVATSPNSALNYALAMAYSPAGRILNKKLQSTAIKNGTQIRENYTDNYSYSPNSSNPYAVDGIGDYKYCWDKLGNMSFVEFRGKPEELMYWTEDNRMQSYNNLQTGQAGFYRYDAGGQRELKLTGKLIDVNNMGQQTQTPVYDNAVLYAGNLVTVDIKGYKKHYFVEGERILTNIGGGTAGAANINIDAEIKGIEPIEVREMSENYTKTVTEYFVKNEHPCTNIMNFYAELGKLPRLDKIFENAVKQGMSDKSYYLYNDRLGSGSVVTNQSGNAEQILCAHTFGDDFLDLSNGFETPYQVFGYEVDMESMLQYAGQRYYMGKKGKPFYNSPDAMALKFSWISAYAQDFNNPIRYIDPDGNEALDVLGSPPDNIYQLPTNPANIDTKVWEVYTPERHTGHSMYWRNRENGTMLAYDKAEAHYHLYKDTRFNVRIDAEGTMSGTKLTNGVKLSKGSKRFHMNGGSKINLSAISRSMGMGMGIFSVIADFFKLSTPDAMFSSFNPNGKLNTCYGVNDPNNVSKNLYYEITGKSKDGSSINVNFYENYYYDHDSKRYRGTGKYMEGVMRKEEKGYRLSPVL
ncbi:MAG: hypothetical protein LBN95_02380, partial [Prevotellaceae bacterium]|nr:hypothetical protein [Prevotellaceae bacterium]